MKAATSFLCGSPMDNKEEISILNPFIANFHELKVLDIGCGDCSLLSNIYNSYFSITEKLIGVDKNTRGNLDISSEHFILNHNSIDGNVSIERKEIVEMYEMDGPTYLKESNSIVNVIIMSNFLHFFMVKDRELILNDASNLLGASGIIYIKGGNENHGDVDYPLSKAELDSLCSTLRLTIDYFNESEEGFIIAVFKSS